MLHDMPLFVGLAVGFSAVPVGPMVLLCIQRSLAAGMGAGFCTGLGAATVSLLYGTLLLLSLGRWPDWADADGRLFAGFSGVVLLWVAARVLMRRPLAMRRQPVAGLSPWRAYGSAALISATNPASLVAAMNLVSPLAGEATASAGKAAAVLGGLFLAAVLWWACLSGCAALLRHWLKPGLLLFINQAIGMLLTAHGALALARASGN